MFSYIVVPLLLVNGSPRVVVLLIIVVQLYHITSSRSPLNALMYAIFKASIRADHRLYVNTAEMVKTPILSSENGQECGISVFSFDVQDSQHNNNNSVVYCCYSPSDRELCLNTVNYFGIVTAIHNTII